MFYSQAGQDVWVLQKISKGFFVDVGAHDGVESSNTYALELAGWKGMCIEPNKEAYKKLVEVRKCLAWNAAIGVNDNQITLTEALVQCPTVIDYLSIDVDGGELDVLKGMDFETYDVKLITIEHNAYLEGTGRQEQIFKYLTEKGFKRVVKDVKCLDPNYFGAIYEDWYENNNR